MQVIQICWQVLARFPFPFRLMEAFPFPLVEEIPLAKWDQVSPSETSETTWFKARPIETK